VTDSSTHRNPKWLPPIALLLFLAAGGATAWLGWTLLGDPSADFLVVAALTEASLLIWAARDQGLSRRQRVGFLGVLFAAPIIGLMFTDVGPIAALRDLFRPTLRNAPYTPPTPRAFDYQYPSSDIVPDLAKTTDRDWPEFRGAGRLGRAASPLKLAVDWKKSPPKLLWQHPVGGGVASFAIVGDFLVSHEQRGKDEVVACYELRTGKQCWEHREEQYNYQGWTGVGPQSTPTIVNGMVVALGAAGRLKYLDGSNGDTRWQVDLFEEHKAGSPRFGITASPLIVDDLVVAGIGGQNGSLVAYELNSGRFRWASGTRPASYSSPLLVTLAGVPQIIWFRDGGLVGCDPKDGRELWTVVWNEGYGNNVCQPLVFSSKGTGEPDAVLISAGDDAGAGAYVVERNGADLKVRELWRNKNLKMRYSSAIQIREMAVGLDEHILAAIDLKTGKRRWKHGDRFGYGQIVASGDQLIIQAEDGRVVIGEATDKEFVERGKFQSVLKQTWNSPALSGDILILRNHETLAAYKLPVDEQRTDNGKTKPVSAPPPESSD